MLAHKIGENLPLGVFYNMPEGEYHSVKALSYSGMKELRRSPAHFQAYLNKEWEVDSDREKYKAVHVLCLEPEMHSKIVIKDGTWARALKDEVIALQKEGKLVLKSEKYEEAKNIAAHVMNHPIAGNFFRSSKPEVSLFWVDDRTGAYCKARIDALYVPENENDDIHLGDLKNFGDLSGEGLINYQITERLYHWQMYFYSKGIKAIFGKAPKLVQWTFVEEKAPHGVKVRMCTDAMLERAGNDIEPLIEKYAECSADDVWPGYEDDALDADLTSYGWE